MTTVTRPSYILLKDRFRETGAPMWATAGERTLSGVTDQITTHTSNAVTPDVVSSETRDTYKAEHSSLSIQAVARDALASEDHIPEATGSVTSFISDSFGLVTESGDITPTTLLDRLDSTLRLVDLDAIRVLFDSVMSRLDGEAVDFALHFLSFTYKLYRLRDLTDLFFAAFDFIRGIFTAEQIRSTIGTIYTFLTEAVRNLYNKLCASRGLHTESAGSTLRDLKSRMNIMMSSELVTSVRDFILSLVSFKFFSKSTSSNVTKVLGPAPAASAVGMIEATLTAAITLVSSAERVQSGEKISEILTSADPVTAFLTESAFLQTLQTLTYTGLPVDGKVCCKEYYSQLSEVVKTGEDLSKIIPRRHQQFAPLTQSIAKMRLLKAQFTNKMSAESRSMPYCVNIEGMPGIGKGTLIDYVASLWSKVKGRTFQPSHIYHRQALEEYWSGYEPLSQPIVHYSEPGSLHKNIAANKGDPVMSEFLSVCDTQPYMCNMADVESKGKVFAMPEMCVMDCNDAGMNLNVIVNNPAAVRRRILYITPTVKPEYKTEGTCRLNVARSLASSTPVLDRWTFRVYRLEPKNRVESEIVTIASDIDIYALSILLHKLFSTHITEQEMRKKVASDIDIDTYLPTVAPVPVLSPEPNVHQTLSALQASNAAAAQELLNALQDTVAAVDVSSDESVQPEPHDDIPYWQQSDYESEWSQESDNLTLESLIQPESRWRRLFRRPQHLQDILKLHLLLFRETSFGVVGIVQTLLHLVALYVFLFTVYVGGNNIILKLVTLKGIKSRIDHTHLRLDYYKGYTFTSLGYSYKYIVVKPVSYQMYLNVAVFSVTLMVLRALCSARFFTEGSMISSSAVRTEEEVQDAISTIERQTGVVMPPSRQKAGNGIDWEKQSAPPPILVQHQNQKKDLTEILNAVSRNTRVINIDAGGMNRSTMAWGVCKDYVLINRHAFHPSKTGWKLTITREGVEGTSKVVTRTTEKDFYPVHGDLVLLRLRGAKFKDVMCYIGADYLQTKAYGLRGTFRGTSVVVNSTSPANAKNKDHGNIPVLKTLTYRYSDHRPGICGSPLIVEFPGGYGVVGIHIAGGTDDLAVAESVKVSQVHAALALARQGSNILDVNSEGGLRLPAYSKGIGSVDKRSPLCFEPVPSLEVYGKIEGYFPQKLGKSQLRSSPFIGHALKLTGIDPFCDGKPLYAAPPFTHRYVDGEYCAPYNHFVKKCGVTKRSLDPRLLERVIDYLSKHIQTSLADVGVTHLDPVPLDVAVNGHPKDFYMRSMKPSTSGGWTFPGAKKKYMESVELDFKEDSYKLLYDVKEQVFEQLSSYSRGEDAHPLLGAQLKDEPRSYEKVRLAKTRVFCMSPFESTVVNRMYLLPFYTLMVEHGSIFGSAIGINMHSTDVDNFVKDLVDFSEDYMEGDYGGFDTSMPYDIGLAANSIVYNTLKVCGYSDDALQQVQGILSDNLYPTVVLRGDLFAAPALQPSGKYATAEDNSLRGLVMLVYAWFSICEAEEIEFDFFENVLPKIYGDDLVAAVKPAAKPYFNNVVYQTFCTEHYGIDYTNAQKTSYMSCFLKLDEISFLKRSFVWRSDLQHWVAPLERASIMKAICYYLPSKQVTRDEQLIDSCTSALRELFFHIEEEEYEPLRREFATVCSEIFDRERSSILEVFPRFDSILGQCYADETYCSDCKPSVQTCNP